MSTGQALSSYYDALRQTRLVRTVGLVRQLGGLSIQAEGICAPVGELCEIVPGSVASGSTIHTPPVLAEVVAVHGDVATLMPYGSIRGLGVGCEVSPMGVPVSCGVGNELLGRVIDAFGQAIDGKSDPQTQEQRPLKSKPINPMDRPRINRVLETGVRSIDALLTLGQGQRVGIFSGSGVGKSTLLGMIVRHARADINVIALIGERGREVREFIDKQLGVNGLRRSVIIVATSDQPALTRLRAAYSALTIAEYFRDQGAQVLLTMDSVTRFAMARREVGLSAGEPPTARGYTPSVFAELPELCERCGTASGAGSITALMTVLVDGDDLNEPISDSLRSILDGHIVLSRDLAHTGQYPAVDILRSTSRVMSDLITAKERDLAALVVRQLALLERNRQMVDIGAYEQGGNEQLDAALAIQPQLLDWLRQQEGGVSRQEALKVLGDIVGSLTADGEGPTQKASTKERT
jgi:flagellum-specific ATP synthase